MRGAGSVYNKVDSFKFLSKVIGSCMMRFEPEPQWLLRRSIWPGLADSLSVHVVVPYPDLILIRELGCRDRAGFLFGLPVVFQGF
jgi:hypothetical protein